MRPAFIIAAASFAAIAVAVFAQGAPIDIVAMLDNNHDGAISRDEFAAPLAPRFAQLDANHDGRLTGDERPSHHGAPAPPQTEAEFRAQALGVFDGEDSNHDGIINGEELTRLRAHIAGGNRPLPAQH
jgi:hypothetical protein